MKRAGPTAPIIFLFATGLLWIAYAGLIGPVFRQVFVFVYLLACPGACLVFFLPVETIAGKVVSSIGISLALECLVSEALLLSGHWSVDIALVIITLGVVIGCIFAVGFARTHVRQSSLIAGDGL